MIALPCPTSPDGFGGKILVVETKGKDIWRGGAKCVDEAILNGTAGLSVDKILLAEAIKVGCTTVAIVVEELCRISVTPVATFSDASTSSMRADYRGRAMRVVPYQLFHHQHLTPPLRKRKTVAIA